MTYPHGETVQLLDGSATTDDEYGNAAPTYPVKATFDNVVVSGADANGTGANEYVQGRDTVLMGLTVYGIPDTAQIAATDKMVARGQAWDIIGFPTADRSPWTGWSPGYVVRLGRGTG